MLKTTPFIDPASVSSKNDLQLPTCVHFALIMRKHHNTYTFTEYLVVRVECVNKVLNRYSLTYIM